jgi:hypothetical protein
VLSLGLATALTLPQLSFAAIEKATVTKVENRVNSGELAQKTTHPVAAREVIGANNYLISEADSRAELQYDDGSLVRIGQHTVFSFNPSARVLSLDRGNLLFHIPKGGGGTIKTASFTAAITGTAGLLWPNKIAVLNGTVKLPSGQVVRSGQIAQQNPDGTFSIKPFTPSQALASGLLYFNGPMPGIDAAFLVKGPSGGLLDGMPELPRPVAEALRAEVAASPANLEPIADRYLQKYPALAGSVIEHALQGIPTKDPIKAAALGKNAVELIYNNLPTARNEVKWVVLALIDGVRDDANSSPSPTALQQILSAVLPAILKNDPALAHVLDNLLRSRFPELLPALVAVEHQFLSPLGLSVVANPDEPSLVLPTNVRVAPSVQPAASQFSVP